MPYNELLNALLWTVGVTLVTFLLSTILMRWLFGLDLREVEREVEDDQNVAVGAFFFIISLALSLFLGFMASDGFTTGATPELAWVVYGLLLAFVLAGLGLWFAVHVLSGSSESIIAYLRREVVDEDNGALALFLGSFVLTPFVITALQLI